MDVAGEPRRIAQARRARDDAPLEKLEDVDAGPLRAAALGLGVGRMRPDQMIDRRAGGRLAAFVEPEVRHHARIIGPQTPGTKRGSAVVAMMQAEVPMM